MSLLALGALLLVAGAQPTPASAAETASIRVELLPQQSQLRLDNPAVTVMITATASSCAEGCQLLRVGPQGLNGSETVLGDMPPTTGPVTLWSTDRHEAADVLQRDSHYLFRSNSAQATHVLSGVLTEAAFTYRGTWHREINLTSGGTLVNRSQPGASASYTVPAPDPAWPVPQQQVGIVSALGPNNGIMSAVVDGEQQASIDLRADRWSPRQVVAVLDVEPGSVVTLHNSTPAARAQRDVHLDGLAINWAGSGITAVRHPNRLVPGVELLFTEGQRLASPPVSAKVEVAARTFGCPSGCTVQGHGASTSWTSPASSALQTKKVPATLSASDGRFSLSEGGRTHHTPSSAFSYLPEVHWDRSDSWVSDPNAGSLGGTILRTATRGAGATVMPRTTWAHGRPVGVVAAKGPENGVMGVYVQGVLTREVDLYASTWQPRRVVAAVHVPAYGRVTVVNRTPASRPHSHVHVDGLVWASDDVCYPGC